MIDHPSNFRTRPYALRSLTEEPKRVIDGRPSRADTRAALAVLTAYREAHSAIAETALRMFVVDSAGVAVERHQEPGYEL